MGAYKTMDAHSQRQFGYGVRVSGPYVPIQTILGFLAIFAMVSIATNVMLGAVKPNGNKQLLRR